MVHHYRPTSGSLSIGRIVLAFSIFTAALVHAQPIPILPNALEPKLTARAVNAFGVDVTAFEELDNRMASIPSGISTIHMSAPPPDTVIHGPSVSSPPVEPASANPQSNQPDSYSDPQSAQASSPSGSYYGSQSGQGGSGTGNGDGTYSNAGGRMGTSYGVVCAVVLAITALVA